MKSLEDFKKHLINKQKAIVFESDEDEGAAEYHGELQTIINAINCGSPASAVKEYCELVGETFPTELM